MCKAGTCKVQIPRPHPCEPPVLGAGVGLGGSFSLGASDDSPAPGWLQRRPHLHSVLTPGAGIWLGRPSNQQMWGWHGCLVPRMKQKKWEVTGGRSLSQVLPAMVAHWGHLVRFQNPVLPPATCVLPWVLSWIPPLTQGSTQSRHSCLWASQVAR